MISDPTPTTARTILEILSTTVPDFDREADLVMVSFQHPVFIRDTDEDVVCFEYMMKLMPSVTISQVRPVISRTNAFQDRGWIWSGVYAMSEIDAVAMTATLADVTLTEHRIIGARAYQNSRGSHSTYSIADVLKAFGAD